MHRIYYGLRNAHLPPVEHERISLDANVYSRWLRLAAAMVLCALTLPTFAANELFTGTWKVDTKRPRLRAPATSNGVLHIDASAEDFNLTRAQEGSSPDLTIHARFDGNTYGVINSNEADAVKCWLSDARTVQVQLFKSAATVEWVTLEVSKDGKTLKWTTVVTDARGKETKSSLVFEKQ